MKTFGAVGWALAYGLLALWWAVGGGGFPFGDGDPDPAIAKGMSILGWVRQERAAPVVAAVVFGAGAVALWLAVRVRRQRPGGRLVEGTAWGVAVFLGVLLPDYRPLVALGHVPVLLVGMPFGWPDGVTIASQLPWPVVNQLVCMGGAWLFATVAAAHRRLRLGREVDSISRWGVAATWTAVAVPLVYAATRYAWALGIPVGFSAEQLRAMDREMPGIWWGGAAMGTLAVLGSVLTVGLVRPWGETFPRWIPLLRGRRVPVPVAVVPAMVVAMAVTSAGLMFTRHVIADPSSINLGINGPAVLWPLWGPALAVAALAYRRRRTGPVGGHP
ncbi:hypothetical protein Voc01_016480 [Virgisporangium ochraceum]|uniref:DUF3995 domain-containing protein n=1 Tax=Virgisporangium ochraceum TaxID=65505 RepID=A0A8J4E9H0_9ACTN|nr:hypothetical protein Voc01_016480 [Virgisporangium ochraceum]